MAKKEEAYVLNEATGKYVLNPKFKAEEVVADAAPAAEAKPAKAVKPAKAAKAKK